MATYPREQQIQLGHGIAIIVRHDGGQWSAESTVKLATRHGDVGICVRAFADETTIRNALKAARRSEIMQAIQHLRAFGMGSDEHAQIAGGVFDDIGHWFNNAGKTLSRSKVFREVSDGIASVAQNPIFQKVVNAIPFVGPVLAPALDLGSKGASLLAHARDGHPEAQAKIRHIQKRAAQGDPEANKALGVLQTLNDSPALQKGQQWTPAALAQVATSLMPREITDSKYGGMVAQYANLAAQGISAATSAAGADVAFDMMVGADGTWRLHPRYNPARTSYGLPFRLPAGRPPRPPRALRAPHH